MMGISVEARAVLDAVKDFSETCHASPPGSRLWVESAWRLDDAWTTYTKSLERDKIAARHDVGMSIVPPDMSKATNCVGIFDSLERGKEVEVG